MRIADAVQRVGVFVVPAGGEADVFREEPEEDVLFRSEPRILHADAPLRGVAFGQMVLHLPEDATARERMPMLLPPQEK